MKVLLITGCVESQKSGRTSFTGLDIVVAQIAQKLSETNEVTILTITPLKRNAYINDLISIKSFSYDQILRQFRFRYLKEIINFFLKGDDFREKIKNCRNYLISKCAKNEYLKINPDIIHFHGVSPSILLLAREAAINKIPFTFSLHGLLSFGNNSISKNSYIYKTEKKFLKMCKIYDIKLSVVSSGIKNILVNKNILNENQIEVILNAYKFNISTNDSTKEQIINIKSIAKGKRIVVCIGSICKNKNQLYLLKELKKLNKKILDKLYFVFLGEGALYETFISEVNHLQLNESVSIEGFVEHDMLQKYYEIADYNIVVSESEGFGMSIIEGYSFGLPTLTFSDLDAISDVFHEEAMVLMKRNSPNCIEEGLSQLLNKDWNKRLIKDLAKKYSSSNYTKYEGFYKSVLSSNKYLNESIIKEIVLESD